MIPIPAQGQVFTQQNIGDVQPNIFISKNLDLTDNMRKVRLGKRLVLNTNEVDAVNVMKGCPIAFKSWSPGISVPTAIFSISGFNLIEEVQDYPGGTAEFGIVAGSTSNYASVNSDMEIFNNDLYSMDQIALQKYTYNSSQSQVDDSYSSESSHLMEVYTGALLYIQDTFSLITNWNGSVVARTGTGTIDLSTVSPVGGVAANSTITGIRAASNMIWISTINQSGGYGYVYQWDGASSSPTKTIRLNCAGAVAMIIKDDVPWIMDVYGRLQSWNGGAFVPVAQLNRRRNQLFYNALGPLNNRFIHPNGMAIINNRINILIDARHYNSAGTIEETIPSGIYEYDENVGLYHKHSFGLSHSGDTIQDYGSNRIAQAGALTELNFPDLSTSRNGTFLAGATYYGDATDTHYGIFYDDSNDTLQKGGYIVTNKIEATDGSVYNLAQLQSIWNKFYTVYKSLLNSSDKIITKYRTADLESVEATINWQDSHTFQVLNSAVNIANYWTGGMGGEVEIMQGIGAGMCAHITGATLLATGYWLVTLDEAFVNISGTAVARFQNWVKMSERTQSELTYIEDNPGVPSNWIQFKVFMLFTGKDEIERFLISNPTDRQIT